MTGWLANHFGRKRMLMASITRIHVGLARLRIGAKSADIADLSASFRAPTGGGLQPLSQAIMLEAFPPEKRGKAMAFWGLGIVVAPMLGPVLGGWITDTYSWRWLFYINLPIGIAGLVMS